MHGSRSPRRAPRARRAWLGIMVLVAVAALMATALTACGGNGVSGTYAFETGESWEMSQFKLTLDDDGSFELAGPNPVGGEKVTITGTYTLDGDKISLTDKEDEESEVGTVDGDKLVFEDVTWVKE